MLFLERRDSSEMVPDEVLELITTGFFVLSIASRQNLLKLPSPAPATTTPSEFSRANSRFFTSASI